MATESRADRIIGRLRAPFASIVCGIDGSRADPEVVRQAALLAGPGGEIELVAVAWESGTGLSAQATLTYAHADRALRAAAVVARKAGVRADTRRVVAPDAGAALVAEAADHDLLVVGASGTHRLGGIAAGRAATRALHRADSAVLLVRPAPGDAPFPKLILLADDGEPRADEAARLAAAIAGRHGAHVDVAAPLNLDDEQRVRLGRHGGRIMEAGAPEPAMVDVHGRAHEALVELARQLGSSLVVIGSRRLSGAFALGSVSERVAHRAPCSVLVARAPDD